VQVAQPPPRPENCFQPGPRSGIPRQG